MPSVEAADAGQFRHPHQHGANLHPFRRLQHLGVVEGLVAEQDVDLGQEPFEREQPHVGEADEHGARIPVEVVLVPPVGVGDAHHRLRAEVGVEALAQVAEATVGGPGDQSDAAFSRNWHRGGR